MEHLSGTFVEPGNFNVWNLYKWNPVEPGAKLRPAAPIYPNIFKLLAIGDYYATK